MRPATPSTTAIAFIGVLCTFACGAPEQELGQSLHSKTQIAHAEVPATALDAAKLVVPGFEFDKAETEVRDGTTYIDLEGQHPDGTSVELDLRLDGNSWSVVEIQRDITPSVVPLSVAGALPTSAPLDAMIRIIESQQSDGRFVYEFFRFDDAGREDKIEVLYDGNSATLLEEEWVH